MSTHGKRATYTRGCRCGPCTTANTAWQTARSRRGQVPDGGIHGYSGFINFGCRCEVCTKAHSKQRNGYEPARKDRKVAQQPKRREVRRPHLDAAVVPVERALLHRADMLDAVAPTAAEYDMEGEKDPAVLAARAQVLRTVAGEFRNLAEELHWVP